MTKHYQPNFELQDIIDDAKTNIDHLFNPKMLRYDRFSNMKWDDISLEDPNLAHKYLDENVAPYIKAMELLKTQYEFFLKQLTAPEVFLQDDIGEDGRERVAIAISRCRDKSLETRETVNKIAHNLMIELGTDGSIPFRLGFGSDCEITGVCMHDYGKKAPYNHSCVGTELLLSAEMSITEAFN